VTVPGGRASFFLLLSRKTGSGKTHFAEGKKGEAGKEGRSAQGASERIKCYLRGEERCLGVAAFRY